MNEVSANISALDYKELKEKYKAVDIDGLIEKKVKYYRLNPFKERTKAIWIEKIKEYIQLVNEDVPETPTTDYSKPKVSSTLQSYYSKKDLAKDIWNVIPYFYDNSKIWWLWDSVNFKWKIVDDKDILNIVEDNSDANTVNSKEKNEIIEAMQQYGRRQIPTPIKKTWIQFKNKLYDIKTGESFEANPKYFVTNPIPYEVSGDARTPKIDEIFEQWVGKDYVETLKEICVYCILPDYPLSRIFCFVGAGMNGKSKYLELLRKFIGAENVCSTELDTLITSRFEVTRLYKKLVCQMGETNFNVINKTSMLKKLTGGDLIGFEYKGKNPFEDINYAKIIIATNNLPATTDKTIGFYRRWVIIDFPNTFSEKKDILLDIPEEEFNNLATFSIISLNKMLEKREFTNEGTIEQRIDKYESKSNFLERFVKFFTEEDLNSFITKNDFYKKFIAWSKENNHREMSETTVGLEMKKLNFESDRKNFNWMNDGKGGQARVWLGIKWKE